MDGVKMTYSDNLMNKLQELGLADRTEKTAKKIPLSPDLFKRIVGLAGGEGTALGQQLGMIGGKGQQAVSNSFIAETKKLLKDQAKKQTAKVMKPSIADETLNVISKTPGQASGGAAVGAGLGAGAGAMVDTSTEETNLLGATKSKPGTISDRLSNMAMGAAVGAGAGGAARARSVAAGNISNKVTSKARELLPNLKAMGADDTLNMALDKLTPAQLTKALGPILNKNTKFIGALDPADRQGLVGTLGSSLDSLMGAPKQRGALEDLLSSARHRVSKVMPSVGGSRHTADGLRELIEAENPALLKAIGAASADPKEMVNALTRVRSGATKLRDQDLSSLNDLVDTFSTMKSYKKPNTAADIALKSLGSGVVGAGAGTVVGGPLGTVAGGILGSAGYLNSALKNAPDKYKALAKHMLQQGNDPGAVMDFITKLQGNKYGPTIQGLV